MRVRDWYFQGWERRPGENGKSDFVYTGEYYTFPGGLRAARARCALLSAALLALYAAVALFPPAGGMWRVAAIPQLLELIPLLYLAMGLVRLLMAREPLTFRDWYASWRRLGRAALGSAVLTACMVLAELVYILFHADGGLGGELLYLLAEIGCLLLSLALAGYIQKHPCDQSAGQTEKE